jgi:hypothetical protein
MKKSLIVLAGVFLLAWIGYALIKDTEVAEEVVLETATTSSQVVQGNDSLQPTFEWTFVSSEKEDIPQTTISLIQRYSDGRAVTKTIDTVGGSCNAYEESDADIYQNSSMIICYYAGLGQYYKVVAKGKGYEVQRKVFEEGSPDYEPAPEQFETIVRF